MLKISNVNTYLNLDIKEDFLAANSINRWVAIALNVAKLEPNCRLIEHVFHVSGFYLNRKVVGKNYVVLLKIKSDTEFNTYNKYYEFNEEKL